MESQTDVAPVTPATPHSGSSSVSAAGGPAPAPAPVNERPRNQTDVYAVHGADPEVLAFMRMAKYSRSSLSMKGIGCAKSPASALSSFSTLSTFNMAIGRSPIWRMWPLPSNG